MMVDGAASDDRPLHELGIKPLSATEYIQTAGSQEPHQPVEGFAVRT